MVGLARVIVLLMATLVVAILWQVVSRYALGSPSVWTEELARFVLIWVGILGAAYAFHEHSHLAIDLWGERLSATRRHRLAKGQSITVMLFALLAMVIGGGRLVLITWSLQQYSPALNIPMALVYAVLPISGLLILLIGAHQLMHALPTDKERHP